ncbi:MAG: hypothetical protein RL367_20 [Pseudomonadota bacterium]|jgi:hypothetical protein
MKFIIAFVPVALFAASAAWAGAIIVRSTGPSAKSLPPGKSLPAAAKLSLKDGDAVTILDSGGTRVFTGPGTFAVISSGPSTGSSFAQFLQNVGGRQSRSAASRGDYGMGQGQSPNIWFADITKPGPLCIVDPAAVYLWRPTPAKPLTVTLTQSSTGKMAKVQFGKGQAVQPWPVAVLPVTDLAQYQLTVGGHSGPVTITLRRLRAEPVGLEDTASALIKNGCSAQTDLLVDTVS